LKVAFRAYSSGGLPTIETPYEPSHMFAPAGLFSTRAERALAKQWDDYFTEPGRQAKRKVH